MGVTVLNSNWRELMDGLDDATRLQVYDAIFAYAKNRTINELPHAHGLSLRRYGNTWRGTRKTLPLSSRWPRHTRSARKQRQNQALQFLLITIQKQSKMDTKLFANMDKSIWENMTWEDFHLDMDFELDLDFDFKAIVMDINGNGAGLADYMIDEQELNGIYNYDRTEKFDAERLYKINTKVAAIEK